MKTKHKAGWFENERLWQDLYPFIFSDDAFAAADTEIACILKMLPRRKKDVLDLGCGPGRCALALARRGLSVTGVDRSQFLLNRAKANARRAKLHVEWVQDDMRDFVRANAFDIALSIFTSFGYFEDKHDDEIVLTNVYKSLRPAGVFLIDVWGKECLAKGFQPAAFTKLADGVVLAERRSIVDNWTRIRNDWVFVNGTRARSYTFDLTFYSGQELKDRLERAGFVDVRLYGDFKGAEYGPKAQRLVAIGSKPISKQNAEPCNRAYR